VLQIAKHEAEGPADLPGPAAAKSQTRISAAGELLFGFLHLRDGADNSHRALYAP